MGCWSGMKVLCDGGVSGKYKINSSGIRLGKKTNQNLCKYLHQQKDEAPEQEFSLQNIIFICF